MRNRNYNASSEIYSLGILFWEMWYGKEAFDDLKGKKMEEFLSVVRKSLADCKSTIMGILAGQR